jgi:hypothetical protein
VRIDRRVSSMVGLALAAAGCAGPQAHVGMIGKQEPLAVAFGKPLAAVVSGNPTLSPVPAGIGVLPVASGAGGTSVVYVDVPGPAPVVPPPPACPQAGPTAVPRDVAQNTIDSGVPSGSFAYRFSGVAVQGAKARTFAGTSKHVVSGAPVGNGIYRFTVVVPMLGATTTYTYTVLPAVSTAADVHGGIELNSVTGNGGFGYDASFQPDKPLQLFSQPAYDGNSWTDAATDARTATVATLSGAIDGTDRVDACGIPLDAWKTTSTLSLKSPDEQITSTVQTWWATQFGGLPIREEQSYSGTAGGVPVSGSVTSVISVDPTAGHR